MLFISLLGFAVSSAQGATVQDLRAGQHSDRTRLVFDLSEPVVYSFQTLEHPLRVIIDISNVDFDQWSTPALSGTPITAIEKTAKTQGGLLVSVFLSRPLKTRSFLLPPELGRGDRLVVDFYELPPELTTGAGTSATDNTALTALAAASATASPSQPAKNSSRPASTSASPSETTGKPLPARGGPQFAFSGTWEQEWAYQTEEAGNQKFEALVEPRLDISFASGSQLVAIARIRLDAVGDLGPFENRPDNYSDVNGPIYNDEYAELSLRELYFDTQWANTYWRLGKQQVVWGQADGIKVLDMVNPQSFREFILDDFDNSRIPLWTVNAEIPLATGSMQLLWIPDTTYHELAEQGSPYFLTSPKWVPQPAPGQAVKVSSFDKPDDPLGDSDVGARYSTFLGGWDITVNYLYHYQDYPVLYQQQDASGIFQVDPTYKRNNLFGGTLSNAFDSVTLRAEVAYSTDVYYTSQSLAERGIGNSDELASVIGLDWQYSGDGVLSTQWFYSYLPDYNRDIVRDESENTVSLLFQQHFANEAWQLRVLGLYSVDDEDSLIEVKLKYWLLGNLEVWLGGDFFHGTQNGTFGQFDKQSRVLMGLEYGF